MASPSSALISECSCLMSIFPYSSVCAHRVRVEECSVTVLPYMHRYEACQLFENEQRKMMVVEIGLEVC